MGKTEVAEEIRVDDAANSQGKKYRNSARTQRAVVLHFRFRCRCFAAPTFLSGPAHRNKLG